MAKKYTIRFDRDGNPLKSDTDKITCGISDQVILVVVILCGIFAILNIIGMLIKN
jgi:hypothetical protein